MTTIELDGTIEHPLLRLKVGSQHTKKYQSIDEAVSDHNWDATLILLRHMDHMSVATVNAIGEYAPLSAAETVSKDMPDSWYDICIGGINKGRHDVIDMTLNISTMSNLCPHVINDLYCNIVMIAAEHNCVHAFDKAIRLKDQLVSPNDMPLLDLNIEAIVHTALNNANLHIIEHWIDRL